MGVDFSYAPVKRTYTWTIWKAALERRPRTFHSYDENPDFYQIWFMDGTELHTCVIWLGEVPGEVISAGYSQEQNDLDKTEFEGALKLTANKSNGYVPTSDAGSRPYVGIYAAASTLLNGSASAQKLLSLENPASSGRKLYLHLANIDGVVDGTATTKFVFRLQRTTAVPSAGSTLTIVKVSPHDAPSPVGIARYSPTVTAASGDIWTASPGTGGGLLGAVVNSKSTSRAFQSLHDSDDVELAEGQAVLISADANDADWSFFGGFTWREVAI